MSQIAIQQFKGIYLQPNSFSSVPDGALEEALNVQISRDNLLQKRRGFYSFGSSYTFTNGTALTEFRSRVFLFSGGNGLGYFSLDGSIYTPVTGTFTPVSNRISTAQAKSNLYFTSGYGVQKISSLTSAARQAGVPRVPDLRLTVEGTSSSGILTPDSQVAYRVCLGILDENGNKCVGSPSPLQTIRNSLSTNKGASLSTLTVTVTHVGHGLLSGTVIKVKDAKDAAQLPVAGIEGSFVISGVTTNTFQLLLPASPVGTLATLSYGTWRTPIVNFSLPVTNNTTQFFQIFRSTESASASILPQEDLQLIVEKPLTSADLSAGYISYVDEVDPLFMSTYLYTNPNSGEGILAANEPPPFCSELCAWKGMLFFGNVVGRPQLPIQLLSSSSTLLSIGSTVLVKSGTTTLTYTAGLTEDVATRTFQVLASGGTTTVSQGIDLTARSLCRVINRDLSGFVDALYLSGMTDVPGQLLLQSRTPTVFSVQVILGTGAFSPSLATATPALVEIRKSAVFFSKVDLPEAVPLTNYILVGNAADEIQRLIPLRDSLLILKRDGVFRLTGDSPGTLSLTLIDGTIGCVAPESVSLLNNEVYFLSTQGVIAASDSGARIISRAIESLLTPIVGSQTLVENTRAVSYESERLYLLTTEDSRKQGVETVYCYNVVTDSWTTWDTPFISALVSLTQDKLYLLEAGKLLVERKAYNKLDYCGQNYPITVQDVATDKRSCVLQFADFDSSFLPDPSMVLVVDDVIYPVSNAIIDTMGIRVYTNRRLLFAASSTGNVYAGYTSRIKTVPLTGGDPSQPKQFLSVQIHFRGTGCSSLLLTNLSQNGSSPTYTWNSQESEQGWGLAPWGSFPWGFPSGISSQVGTEASAICRVLVPSEVSRGAWQQLRIEHRKAAEPMEIQSICWTVRIYGNRTTE